MRMLALRVIAFGVLLGIQLSGFLYLPSAAAAPAGPTASTKWSQPIEVSGALGGWFPDVAADDSGSVSIVWQTSLAEPSQQDVSALYFTRWNGTTWSKPNDIALISPAGAALRSSLVADSSGRLHLIYKGLGTLQPSSLGEEQLWYTSATPGTASSADGWGTARQITLGSQGYYSDIAIDSKGVIHTIWTESANGVWGIYYSHSTDGGLTWSPRVPLDDASPVWWYRAHLVVDSHDGLHIVWETLASPEGVNDPSLGFGSTQSTAYARSTDGGASWTKTSFTDNLPPYLGLSQLAHGPQQPAIGVDGSGRILLVYRAPNSNLVLYRQSTDGKAWSVPKPLPGVQVGVPRPFDIYDMVTDSAGHVHLAIVGYQSNSDKMSLLHLEWSGDQWSLPDVITTAPEYPEYPKLAISNGNQLHVVWFSGDKSSIDRTPTGIWYSTTTTSAPATESKALPPPVAQSVAPTPAAIQTPVDLAVSQPVVQPETPAAPAGNQPTAPSLIARLEARPDYPLLLVLFILTPLLVIYVGVQVGLSRKRGFRNSRLN